MCRVPGPPLRPVLTRRAIRIDPSLFQRSETPPELLFVYYKWGAARSPIERRGGLIIYTVDLTPVRLGGVCRYRGRPLASPRSARTFKTVYVTALSHF